ncbi:thiosulfate:glutathione sulfurtransferase-like isoform X1 [Pelobates fuscus]|uniref:thiosulfate:glutathione sulfurtransferase-like isoform X1 n=1 Tax=Pelobates fuscus TaxID=191477 RepID=UPI002FE44AD5
MRFSALQPSGPEEQLLDLDLLPPSIINHSHYTITSDELKKLNAQGTAQIFDVRTPEEVQNGKISNAINIPITEFEDAFKMDPETFAKIFKVDKPKLDDNIVVHCQSGRRGARAADIASSLGYKHVQNLVGGYKEWSQKEGKLSTDVCHFGHGLPNSN